MIIGITGNSGSGKTLISKLLGKELNTDIIDADKVVYDMSIPGAIYFKEIVKEFGEDILLENREINKKKLANIIFSDAKKREILNSLTFKYVVEEITKRANLSKNKIVILDAPLLIESKLNKICDTVISVIANENVKIQRICKRDNIDENIAKKRIGAQPKNDFYIENSNYIVINNDNSNLENQIKDITKFIESRLICNSEILITQDINIKILQFKKLMKYKDYISHAFTLKPLNFGSNDTYKAQKEEVDNNYKLVCEFLKLDSKNVIRPYQTHTNNVKEVYNEVRNF